MLFCSFPCCLAVVVVVIASMQHCNTALLHYSILVSLGSLQEENSNAMDSRGRTVLATAHKSCVNHEKQRAPGKIAKAKQAQLNTNMQRGSQGGG